MLRFIFASIHLSLQCNAQENLFPKISVTSVPRIFKYDTNFEYGLFYCVRENRSSPVYHSLYLFIFVSLQKTFAAQRSLCLGF